MVLCLSLRGAEGVILSKTLLKKAHAPGHWGYYLRPDLSPALLRCRITNIPLYETSTGVHIGLLTERTVTFSPPTGTKQDWLQSIEQKVKAVFAHLRRYPQHAADRKGVPRENRKRETRFATKRLHLGNVRNTQSERAGEE